MQMRTGTRVKLAQHVDTAAPIEVVMRVQGTAVYDFSCFGVDVDGQLSDDRYMVFYNQTTSPEGAILYRPQPGGAEFSISLESLPASIDKLVFTAGIDGAETMAQISSFGFSVAQFGRDPLELELFGGDFGQEKAIISAEIYEKGGEWRLSAVAQGFNGGLPDLLAKYGGEQVQVPPPQPDWQPESAPQPVWQPASAPQPGWLAASAAPQVDWQPTSAAPSKVILKKGEKVSLKKREGASSQEIVINLNWSRPVKKGLLGPKAIDLDLGCLYEMMNGSKGVVQAIGRRFGSLGCAPYIQLDNDDRSGAVASGENLRINTSRIHEIRRILVYALIYEGVVNWQQSDGVVTVSCPGNPEIIVHMDEYDFSKRLCGIALLEDAGGDSFMVERIVRFYSTEKRMDRAFNWGLRWTLEWK